MVLANLNPANSETYDLLMQRRSVKTRDMQGPGPDRTVMTKILAAGMRVPDHGMLTPWRFIVLEGAEREKLGDIIVAALISEKETSEKIAEKMKNYATQAPTLVIAISNPGTERPIPEWEQHLSVGAACQNMLVAATALGFAGQWLTGWASYSPTVCTALGMGPNEKIAGFMFFGHHGDEQPAERARPQLDNHVIWGWPADVAE